MMDDRAILAALVGSRLCHDLISPIGAIQNGLELVNLAEAGGDTGPEMALIQDSCDNAAARIRFFRIAFGSADDSTAMGASEIAATFEAMTRNGRVKADWQIAERLPRSVVQLALLAYMCAEAGLPMGGRVTMTRQDDVLTVVGEGRRVKTDPDTWGLLAGAGTMAQVTPAQVQFALLSTLARDRGARLRVEPTDTKVTITVG